MFIERFYATIRIGLCGYSNWTMRLLELDYAATRIGLCGYSHSPQRVFASAKGNIPLSECEFSYFSITIVSLEYRWRSTMSRRSSDISETMP